MTRWQRFRHHMLEWHQQGSEVEVAGINNISRCPTCGVRVMLDSQGNWFRCEAWPVTHGH